MTTHLVSALCVLLAAAAPSLAEPFEDRFDDPATPLQWAVLGGDNGPHESIDVGRTRDGWLTVRPRPNHAWYNEGMGPMLHRAVAGDFLVETRVQTHSANNPGTPPSAHYNSAGLIVRDPASTQGRQNWVVTNVGRQDPHTGTEVKTTTDSRSVLELQPGPAEARLRLARLGDTIYALRRFPDDDAWTLIRTYDRPDLPDTVQVGLMCNGWTGDADLVAQYDYVRINQPTSVDDLTAE